MPLSLVQSIVQSLKVTFSPEKFKNSSKYWHDRYAKGGNSGSGSYGKLANFKAETINAFVAENSIGSVIEFGCGDGNQLRYAKYRGYLGVDISQDAIDLCRSTFSTDSTKKFVLLPQYNAERAELALSLDVIFHLVEDDIFSDYMHMLFDSAKNFVIIYSSNREVAVDKSSPHVRHREFSKWIEKNASEWQITNIIVNKYPYDGNHLTTTFSDFYFYARRNA